MSFLDRLMGREPARKAVPGGAWLNALQSGPSLVAYGNEWQDRARLYLDAYRVGWFYKAGSRISRDFANLMWTLAYEDTEGDNAEEIVAGPSNVPFEQLNPLEQFLRLSERPNPYQTGRSFKQQQMIRLDFTGRALTYLENADGGGLATGFYGINPCRMWQSRDRQGRLIGWVLDKNAPSGGTPFTSDEILVTEYPGVDADPQGVVEAVYAYVPLTKQLPQHTSDVLATGGRLAGMAWPKERTLTEDEFADAQRAWRNVTSDPNAARRLLLFPEPMEYQQGAATPAEIGIPELASLSRDEILTAFPISPHMLHVPLATGLNSGATLGEVRHDYWEGTQHPRVEVWEDSFQQQYIPRLEKIVGRALDFDIEEPNLDDAPAIVEKVGALRGLIAVGFNAEEAIAAVGLDHIEWEGLPDLLDPAKQAEMAQQAAADPAQGLRVVAGDTNRRDPQSTQQTVIGKAVNRDDVMRREFPGFEAVLREFLAEQRVRVIDRITQTFPASKAERKASPPDDWWDTEAEDAALREQLRGIYVSLGRDAVQVVSDNTGRIIGSKALDKILEDMLGRAGLRITDINETTRRTIADTLSEGVRRGYSIPQLTSGVAAEGYGGVQGALMANGVNVWDDLRAETIARTETMNAYNTAALVGYKEVAVRQVVAIDGDKDAECATRDGQAFTVDDALNVSDHPNGTLDWIPLTD